MYVCVCVCVREREKEKEADGYKAGKQSKKEKPNARQCSNLTLNFTYCAIYYMGNKCKFCSQCRCNRDQLAEKAIFFASIANECASSHWALSIARWTFPTSNGERFMLSTNRSETNNRIKWEQKRVKKNPDTERFRVERFI